uniref:Uncharacterized protein n=1 Tax=Setaria italica TaxID=4555 RepID=K3YXM0_SETIT
MPASAHRRSARTGGSALFLIRDRRAGTAPTRPEIVATQAPICRTKWFKDFTVSKW